jgi:electron transport complex protein RnfD
MCARFRLRRNGPNQKRSQKMIGKSRNKENRVYRLSLTNRELVVEPAPHVTGHMTKDLLMKYTFFSLCILAATAIIAFGITALIIEIIAVIVAIISDFLLSLVMKNKGPLNLYSAAVSGLIVASSFSSGIPYSVEYAVPTMDPVIQYVAVAVISAVTVILFKKIQGLLGRKYLNPVATAKLLVLVPIWNTALIPQDHLIAAKISSFTYLQGALQMCYSYNAPFKDPLLTLIILKNHGWLGGASSIAVIVVGIILLVVCRGYLKWRIPLTFLATTAIISSSYGLINGEDIFLRVAYHLFVGSVIFLAFFMATDPATTPLTGFGQIIFAIGLGMLTFILQIWGNFLGGSILALIIMNLTVPFLDRVVIRKPFGRR